MRGTWPVHHTQVLIVVQSFVLGNGRGVRFGFDAAVDAGVAAVVRIARLFGQNVTDIEDVGYTLALVRIFDLVNGGERQIHHPLQRVVSVAGDDRPRRSKCRRWGNGSAPAIRRNQRRRWGDGAQNGSHYFLFIARAISARRADGGSRFRRMTAISAFARQQIVQVQEDRRTRIMDTKVKLNF